MQMIEENLTANMENVNIQIETTETIQTESTVFFMDFSIFKPAEKMR